MPTLTSFHDDALHLTFGYPAGFVDASALVGPALQASLGDDATSTTAARCITLPFSRMAALPTPGAVPAAGKAARFELAVVALAHADAACLHRKFNAKSLGEFTQGEIQGLNAAGAHSTFGKPMSYTLDTRPATVLIGTFTLPTGQSIRALVTCVLTEPDILCWQVLAGSAGRLRALASLPVSFGPAPATALVPANLLPPA